MSAAHCGVLAVNKPAGVTSRGVVNAVQRLVRPAKVGHAGTLDPLARGVLVVCLGPATRLIEYVQRLPKRYCGEFLLGRSSPTDDIEGPITEAPDAPRPSLTEIDAHLAAFRGTILQRPSDYSAVKVAGRRAYELARAGKTFELAPREVTLYRIEIVAYDYPRLALDLECSGGTYVRALGRDLAASLGTAAVMSALERTAIGRFVLAESIALEMLSAAALAERLLPPASAVAALPQRVASAAAAARLRKGQFVHLEDLVAPAPAAPCAFSHSTIGGEPTVDGEIAVLDECGELVGVASIGKEGTLRPRVNLPPPGNRERPTAPIDTAD